MKSRRSVFSALIFFLFLAALSGVKAGAAKLVSDLPAEAFLWTRKLPAAVVGSPALNADSTTLYVAAVNRRFYGLDTISGETNWTVRLPAAPTSSPVVDDDGSIYVGCANGVLYRINDEDGAGRLDPLFHPFLGGSISSPAVGDDGTVYAGSTANHLYALRSDGSKLWVYNGSSNVKTPIIADDTIFIVSGGYVRGIGIDDGVEKSSFTPRAAIHSIPALGEDGTLYFGANDERIYALNSGGTTNDWRFNTGKNVMSSPAIGPDGSIYIASDNLRLYRLNANGVPAVWTNRVMTPAPIRSALSIGADGTIYAGCENGRLYAFSGDDGHVLWTVKTRAPVRSSAVIDSRNVVYFSSGRTVYAVTNNVLEGEGIDEPVWQMFRKDRQHTARATVTISATNPPVISEHPTNQIVEVGATASFSVGASSISPLAYQWYFNSNAIVSSANSTATTATLTITNVTSTNAGFYHVIVSNSFGQATSAVVTLTVTTTNGAPVILQQPTNQTVAINATVNFSVAIAGAQPFSYQWSFNNGVIDPAMNATATNSTLTLSNVTISQEGFYEVVITNSFGAVTSALARLTVTTNTVPPSAPVITRQPSNLIVGEGTSASFSVMATGAPAPAYQWYFSTNAISSGSNPTAVTTNLLLINVQGANAGFYFVVATNAVGSVTSVTASLTVTNIDTVWLPNNTNGGGMPLSNSPPFITQQPTNRAALTNTTVSFTVIAYGALPLFYQWYDGTVIIDAAGNATATNATLTFASVNATNTGSYHVVVSNSFGSVTSVTAILIVTNSPFGSVVGSASDRKSISIENGEIRIGSVAVNGDSVAVEVSGRSDRRKLVLEYTDGLSAPEWKPLSTNASGQLKLIDPMPPLNRSRYYRVRAE